MSVGARWRRVAVWVVVAVVAGAVGLVPGVGARGAGGRVSCACGAAPTAATTYGYDPAGRLVEVDGSTSQERVLRPDGLVDAVTFTTGTGSTTHRVDWDAANPVPQVHAFNATSITTTLVRGPTGWAAQRRGVTDWSIGSDVHGSATATVSSSVAIAPASSFDPSGVANATFTRPVLGYRGELTLGLLVNLRARDHHPASRQFTTTDPLPDQPGDPTAGNPYHYALNDPINLTDPLGLYPGAERAGLDEGSLLDGLGAGLGDWFKDLGIGFIRDLVGMGKQLTGGCDLLKLGIPPGPDWGCIASNGIDMIGDAFGQIRSAIEDAMSAGDGVRSLLSALSVALPIDMEACEKDGWHYCVAKAAAPMLIDALITGGAALTKQIASITRNLTRIAPDQAPRRGVPGVCAVNSFVPGTQVLMADGSSKPIEQVEVGDRVWASDPEIGEAGVREVTHLIEGDGTKRLVDIEIDGEVITATDGHPFWVDDQGRWVDAEDLEAGDVLLLADDTTVIVDTVRERTAVRQVHNLTVDGIHTYHVLAGDDAVLVHNTNPKKCDTDSAGLLDDATGNYGPFHRLAGPTQTTATAALQGANGEVWGATARGGLNPTVKAYQGPLPAGARGVEFTTPVRPSDIGLGRPGDIAIWRRGSPGVVDVDDDFVKITCTVVRNTQC